MQRLLPQVRSVRKEAANYGGLDDPKSFDCQLANLGRVFDAASPNLENLLRNHLGYRITAVLNAKPAQGFLVGLRKAFGLDGAHRVLL